MVDSIVKLGTRDLTLGMSCFNVNTIYTITQKLPFQLISKSYELKAKGEEKLKQILDLIKKARVKGLNRATDMTNIVHMALTPSPKSKESGQMVMNRSATHHPLKIVIQSHGIRAGLKSAEALGNSTPPLMTLTMAGLPTTWPPGSSLSTQGSGRTAGYARCWRSQASTEATSTLAIRAEMNMEERFKTAHNAGFCIHCLSIDFIFKSSISFMDFFPILCSFLTL